MLKWGQVRRPWLLAGLFLGVSLIGLSLYSISVLAGRSEPPFPWPNGTLPDMTNQRPAIGTGAVLSVEMTARGYWIPATVDTYGPENPGTPENPGGDVRLTEIALQAGQRGVERKLCITNTGTRETRGLAIQDRIDGETAPGVFEPAAGLQLVYPVNRELTPRERWCQVEKIDFSPTPGARHRITTTISITNHAQLLPGSSQCPGPDECIYSLAVSAIFQIPTTSAMLLTSSTPAILPSPQATSTPASRSGFTSHPNQPPANPPDQNSPPPAESVPTSRPEDTATPQPRRSTRAPDPTWQEPRPSTTPRPTRTPAPPEPTSTRNPDPTQPPDNPSGRNPHPPHPPHPDKKPHPTKPPNPEHPPKPTKIPKNSQSFLF